MRVDIQVVDDISVVKPFGDIRVKTIVALRNIFEQLDRGCVRTVAIDLSEVPFIDSSAIGLLVNFAKRLIKRNGMLSLFNYSADLKQLLDITGIEQAVGIFDSYDLLLAAKNTRDSKHA